MRSRWLLLGGAGFLVALTLGLIAGGSSSPPTSTSAPTTTTDRNHGKRQREQPRPLTTRSPNTIAFWDESRGLLGTGRIDYGDGDGGSTGRVLLTDDGGKTFRVVLRTKAAVNWLDTAGEGDAWAIIGTRAGTKQIMHSSDGGQTWQRLPGSQAWGLSFGTPTEGLAVAGGGIFSTSQPVRRNLLSTSDGGATWHPLPDPCPRTWYATVNLATAAQAWVVCQQEGAVSLAPKSVFSSADRGESWQRLAYVDDDGNREGGLALIGYPSGLNVSPEGLGFIWGVDFGYVTRDGGSNWHQARGLPERGRAVLSAAMVSGVSGFVLDYYSGRPHRLFGTHDGGRTWAVVHRWEP